MKPYEKLRKNRFRRKMAVRNAIRSSRNYRVRLSVHKTAKHIYAQLIDDRIGKTLAAASTLEKEMKKDHPQGGNTQAAKALGSLIAKRILEQGIKEVAFDRGSFRFHGRVKALADAAREAGLSF